MSYPMTPGWVVGGGPSWLEGLPTLVLLILVPRWSRAFYIETRGSGACFWRGCQMLGQKCWILHNESATIICTPARCRQHRRENQNAGSVITAIE